MNATKLSFVLMLLVSFLVVVPVVSAEVERSFVSAHTGSGPFMVNVPEGTELLLVTRHYWWVQSVHGASLGGVALVPVVSQTGSMTAIIYAIHNPSPGQQQLILQNSNYGDHVRVYAYTGVDFEQPTGATASRQGSYAALSLETREGDEVLWAHTRGHGSATPVAEGDVIDLFNAQVQDTVNAVGYSPGLGTVSGGWSAGSGATVAVVVRAFDVVDARLPGDANRDGVVDVNDLLYIVSRLGRTSGQPEYSADADLNGDGVINIFDIVIVGRNFGRTGDTGEPPTLTFTANPSILDYGQQTTLTWSSQHTTSCLAQNGWSGNRPVSGSQTITPTSSTTYQLRCTGLGGTVSESVTVGVRPGTPEITTLRAVSSSLHVRWNLGGAATSHDVHMSTTPGFTPSPANRVAQGLSGTTDQFVIQQLQSETTYYVRVVAHNQYGLSSSAQASQTTGTTPDYSQLYVGMNRASDLVVRTNNTWPVLTPPGWGYTRYRHTHATLSPGHPLEGEYIGEHRLVSEASVPDGSGQVLEVWYYDHFPSGFEPGVHRFSLPSGTQDVYVGVWYRYRDPNFQWAASKSLLIAANGGFMWWGPSNSFQYNSPPGDPCHVPSNTLDGVRSSISNRDGRSQYGMGDDEICWNVGDPVNAELVRGEWFLLEFEVRRSNNSGRQWINGVLVGESSDMYWASTQWVEFQIGHTHGGGVPDKTQDDFLQIGQIMIATRT